MFEYEEMPGGGPAGFDTEVEETPKYYTDTDGRIAGEYFPRDGNMNLLFTALGQVLGQLGSSIADETDLLDNMFVPDGSKVKFNTLISGLPPTSTNLQDIGFMDTTMPWWFSLEVVKWDATPAWSVADMTDTTLNDPFHLYSDWTTPILSGFWLDPTTIEDSASTEDPWDAIGCTDTPVFGRLLAEDFEEWFPDTDPSTWDYWDSGYILMDVGTINNMANWNWMADETWEYPNETTAPLWRALGGKSISWGDAYSYVSAIGEFSDANYMTFKQESVLINWFDTMVNDDILAAWAYESATGLPWSWALSSDPAKYASTGVSGEYELPRSEELFGAVKSMVTIDANMVLDYEDVSPVVPLGEYGVSRTNPYTTSTLDPSNYYSSPIVSGDRQHPLETSPEVQTMLAERYREHHIIMAEMGLFVANQSKLVEATLYSSIGAKQFTTKMQKSQPIREVSAVEGDYISSDTAVTTDTPDAATVIEETKSAAMTTSVDSGAGVYGGY